jgi:VWFA-related protein
LLVAALSAPASGGPQAPAQPPGKPAASPGEPAASPPQAQAETAGQPPPRFRTEANYVRVDVYPTRNGTPVQDLTRDEFEILENGQRQSIQAFEHVVISPAGPQTLRTEADSVRGAEQMAANPRNRVFVIFLDIPHVAVEGSHHIKEPLIRLIDRVLGPDDLVAVMTPEMSAAQLTFGRKTAVIADMLRDRWFWGARHSIVPMDQREVEYESCYPSVSQRGVVAQMVSRRRERIVLDALHDLVRYLGGVREERKAIVTVTDGWVLYRPDPSLTQLRAEGPNRTEPVPGNEPVGVDEHGKLRVGGSRYREGESISRTTCDRERMHLAAIDNHDHFLHLLDAANRHNASFYPVDPRGLPAFDYPIGPAPPPPITVDHAILRERRTNLETLATATDGIAVVNSNDLDRGLRRMAEDLTSYYLLGYYSTNTRMDGAFRRISVRVKRPGVEVRARRGYRAPTAEEVNASRAAAAAPVPEHVRTTNAALASLEKIRPEHPFAIHAAAVRDTSGAVTAIWVAGEVQTSAREFAAGATAAVDVKGADAQATSTLARGERAFLVKVPVSSRADSVDVSARLSADAAAAPLADSVRLDLAGGLPQPLLFRRGLTTGNRVQPAADFRFSRTERLRLELPVPSGTAATAGRMLDRNGQPLQVPVQVGERTDADGQRWLTGDATLAPLAPGDYLIEITYTGSGSEGRVLTAIRVTR